MFKRAIFTILFLFVINLLSAGKYINSFDKPESISRTAIGNFQQGRCKSSIAQVDGKAMLKLSRNEPKGYSALKFSRITFPVKKGQVLNASINCLNKAQKANFHIYLQPGHKRLRIGSGARIDKWQTLKIENWVADKDYESMDIRLWCDGKGDVFFDKLHIKTHDLADEWENKQSFESSDFLRRCRMRNWGKGQGKAELSNKFVRDGKNTLKLSRENPDGYSCLQLPEINLPVKKGKVITVKVWCVNFCKRGSMHVELYPKRKRLRTGLSGMVEWGETLKIKFQADKDYQSLRLKLWVSGKGKVFFDKLQVTVGGEDSLSKKIVYPCNNKLIKLPKKAAVKGIILFNTPSAKKVYPNYIPASSELIRKSLKLSLAPEENRLLALGVYSKEFSGTIKAEIKGLEGIKSICYRPKMQKLRTEMKSSDFAIGPRILEPGKTLNLHKNQSGQFIVAFKAVQGLSSGNNKGKIVLTSSGNVLTEVPIELEILPFKLVNPPVHRLMWAGWAFSKFGQNKKKLEACLRDMKEHGMTTVEGALIPHLKFKNDDVEVDYSNLKNRIAAFHNVFDTKIMMVKGANNIGSAVCRSINPNWTDNVPSRSKKPSLKDPKRWKLFDKAYRIWTDYLLKSGIEPYMYAYDEPGGHVWRNQAIETIKHCKQVRPDAKIAITTSMEFAETMNNEINVNVFPYYAEFNPVKAKRFCEKNNDIFWVYGQCWSNAPRAAEVLRYEAGFYAWAIRTKGIGWWCYMCPVEDPYNDLDGKAQDFMMSYLTPNGMTPTLNWEAIGEGINDMKYLYTLEAAIQKGKKTKPKAAKSAQELIVEIKRKIPMKVVYILSPSSIKHILNAKQMDLWRNKVIKAIKSLN